MAKLGSVLTRTGYPMKRNMRVGLLVALMLVMAFTSLPLQT
jgi:hypothetical protein